MLHVTQPGGAVERHPATLSLIDRHRTRREICRRSDCLQAVNIALKLKNDKFSLPARLRPEQDSNLRPTA
jgi:hypothetical protein